MDTTRIAPEHVHMVESAFWTRSVPSDHGGQHYVKLYAASNMLYYSGCWPAGLTPLAAYYKVYSWEIIELGSIFFEASEPSCWLVVIFDLWGFWMLPSLWIYWTRSFFKLWSSDALLREKRAFNRSVAHTVGWLISTGTSDCYMLRVATVGGCRLLYNATVCFWTCSILSLVGLLNKRTLGLCYDSLQSMSLGQFDKTRTKFGKVIFQE